MKPANFPERKRQRQLRALKRINPNTAGKPKKGIEAKSNDDEIVRLHNATFAGTKRDVRTKKDRSATGRVHRA